MKTLLKSVLGKTIFSLIGLLSLISYPVNLAAENNGNVNAYQDNVSYQNTNYQGDDCCPEQCSPCFKTEYIVLGALIIGGAAAAIIACSDHHKHHHSDCDDTCSTTSPCPPCSSASSFHPDCGQILEFNISAEVSPSSNQVTDITGCTTATLTPFVTVPDGKVVTGVPITVELYGSEYVNFEPIIINDPLFGNYAVGVKINNVTGSCVDGTLSADVVASRDNSTTILPSLDIPTVCPGEQFQISTSFTYDVN